MYKIIAQALEKEGLSHKYHPLDYLNFYCLGKREPLSSSQPSSQAMNQQSENHAVVYVCTLFMDSSFDSSVKEVKHIKSFKN